MQRILILDILHLDPFNSLILIVQLADTADRHAETIVEVRVLQGYVRTVCFERDAVVAVVDG
jgi:hypothetical protein